MQARINAEIDNNQQQGAGNLRILSAVYGQGEVTKVIQEKLDNGERVFKAKNAQLGDSWVGTRKTLAIVYLDGNTVKTKICKEHQSITLP